MLFLKIYDICVCGFSAFKLYPYIKAYALFSLKKQHLKGSFLKITKRNKYFHIKFKCLLQVFNTMNKCRLNSHKNKISNFFHNNSRTY